MDPIEVTEDTIIVSDGEETPTRSNRDTTSPVLSITLNSLCDDPIINGYLTLLRERNVEYPTAPQIDNMDTFFFQSVTALRGFEGAARGAMKRNLWAKDFILFPLHEEGVGDFGHWSLIVVCPAKKLIRSYDSAQREHPTNLRQVLSFLDYLATKQKLPFNREEWTLKGNPSRLPLQTNRVDCGFWVCFFASCLAGGEEPETRRYPGSKTWRQTVATALRRHRAEELQGYEWSPPAYLRRDPAFVSELPSLEELEEALSQAMADSYIGEETEEAKAADSTEVDTPKPEVAIVKEPDDPTESMDCTDSSSIEVLSLSPGRDDLLDEAVEEMPDADPGVSQSRTRDTDCSMEIVSLSPGRDDMLDEDEVEKPDTDFIEAPPSMKTSRPQTPKREVTQASGNHRRGTRMKRRVKWIRLEDGTRKRVNVRKLGLQTKPE